MSLWHPDEKCIRCELRAAVPGLRSCEVCLERLRSARRGDQEGAVPDRECSKPGCRRPPAPGRRQCWRCLDQARPILARAAAAAKAAGVCADCRKAKRAPGRSRCRGCTAKTKDRQLDMNAWGHCNCGRVLDGKSAVLCLACLARNAANTRRYRAAGRGVRRRRRGSR